MNNNAVEGSFPLAGVLDSTRLVTMSTLLAQSSLRGCLLFDAEESVLLASKRESIEMRKHRLSTQMFHIKPCPIDPVSKDNLGLSDSIDVDRR